VRTVLECLFRDGASPQHRTHACQQIRSRRLMRNVATNRPAASSASKCQGSRAFQGSRGERIAADQNHIREFTVPLTEKLSIDSSQPGDLTMSNDPSPALLKTCLNGNCAMEMPCTPHSDFLTLDHEDVKARVQKKESEGFNAKIWNLMRGSQDEAVSQTKHCRSSRIYATSVFVWFEPFFL
jgi:hypothetical protein